jgi:hypothetical protein
MNIADELVRAIKLAIKKELQATVTEGTVTAVDKAARTCEVDRDDLPDLMEVRLNAILEAGDDLVTIYPKVGSKVLCLIINNDQSDAYVIAATDIEEISGQIGEMTFVWNADGFVFNGGENGELIKINDLVSKINTIEQDINALKQVLTTWVVAPMDGGLALKTAAAAWMAQTIIQTSVDDLKDDKIQH